MSVPGEAAPRRPAVPALVEEQQRRGMPRAAVGAAQQLQRRRATVGLVLGEVPGPGWVQQRQATARAEAVPRAAGQPGWLSQAAQGPLPRVRVRARARAQARTRSGAGAAAGWPLLRRREAAAVGAPATPLPLHHRQRHLHRQPCPVAEAQSLAPARRFLPEAAVGANLRPRRLVIQRLRILPTLSAAGPPGHR